MNPPIEYGRFNDSTFKTSNTFEIGSSSSYVTKTQQYISTANFLIDTTTLTHREKKQSLPYIQFFLPTVCYDGFPTEQLSSFTLGPLGIAPTASY